MASGLKVIALISGGKDSIFSILHCIANGHAVVALANLHPPLADGAEDIDSFMYQTVGHNIIPLYEEALGIPLYRQEIKGGAANDAREYAPANGGEEDETESLMPLLKRIKEDTPAANAISTGAILSTYQRTRVESVAIRLGLTPLSYLWQYLYLPPYRQTSLLDDMRAVGQDARIIKVASGGLDESFLWKDVADSKTIAKMKKRMEMYGGGEGGALIGEGGEFETLALDGPAPLWKKKIEVDEVEMVTGDGGSAMARLKNARLVTKSADTLAPSPPRIPALLDKEFELLLHTVEKLQIVVPSERTVNDASATLSATPMSTLPMGIATGRGYLQISNIASPTGYATDQMSAITTKLREQLAKHNFTTSNVTHATLLLRRMSDFVTINPIYGSLFTKPNPPSRITISCGDLLPKGVDVGLSVVLDIGKEDAWRRRRQGLHVQSRSYWAPANIGPYSQAISTNLFEAKPQDDDDDASANGARLVHVAGQIPLVPASMEMVEAAQMPFKEKSGGEPKSRKFMAQAVLSLQHLWRIGRAMEVVAWTGAIAFIPSCSREEAKTRTRIACSIWTEAHSNPASKSTDDGVEEAEEEEEEEAEDTDIWDLQNRIASLSTSPTDTEKDTRAPLPGQYFLTPPPVFIVQVCSLPRDADIEWCSTGLSSLRGVTYLAEDEAGVTSGVCTVREAGEREARFVYRAFTDIDGLSNSIGLGDKAIATVYTTSGATPGLDDDFAPFVVPCSRIMTCVGEEVREFAVLVVSRRNKEW